MQSNPIPVGWIDCSLGDVIARVVGGGTPSRGIPAYWVGNIPWASVKDFKDETQWLHDTEEHISSAGLVNSAANLIEAGIPIVCTRMAVGRAAIPVKPVAINQDLKALYPHSHLNPSYLLILLNFIRPQLESLSIGSTVKGINVNQLLTTRVNLPPLNEQQCIAEILQTIDQAIARTESLIAKLKQMKAGLLHDLLTRGLDENGELRDAIAHPEQFKDSLVGQIPNDWKVVDLVSVCKRITDGSHQSVKTSDNGVPFLYVSCIRDGQILWNQAARIAEKTYKEISKGREPSCGLILYTAVGSYGHAALVQEDCNFSFQRHIAYVLPNAECVVPEYLVRWLNSPQCRMHADVVALGNAQKTVTLGELASFPVPLPGLEEQKRIAAILDNHDARIRVEEVYRDKLKLQKKGLMHDLLTGRVRVNTAQEAIA